MWTFEGGIGRRLAFTFHEVALLKGVCKASYEEPCSAAGGLECAHGVHCSVTSRQQLRSRALRGKAGRGCSIRRTPSPPSPAAREREFNRRLVGGENRTRPERIDAHPEHGEWDWRAYPS